MKVVCENCGFIEDQEPDFEADLCLVNFCPKCEDKATNYYHENFYKILTP
jgi:hypothetical protein